MKAVYADHSYSHRAAVDGAINFDKDTKDLVHSGLAHFTSSDENVHQHENCSFHHS